MPPRDPLPPQQLQHLGRKQLIVNADDFGLSPGVNEGIIEGHCKGIITSATLLANAPAVIDAVRRATERPSLGTGCHLTLIGGKGVAEPVRIRRLIDRNGNLPRDWLGLMARLAGGLSSEEITEEFRAQLRYLSSLGVQLTHVDSHKHTHMVPRVLQAALDAASEFGIPAIRNPIETRATRLPGIGGGIWNSAETAGQYLRVVATRLFSAEFRRRLDRSGLRAPAHFYGVTHTGRLSAELLERIAASLTPGVSELMCHPGRLDQALAAEVTRLKGQRESELHGLTSPRVRKTIRELGIELVDYRLFSQVG